MRLVEDDEYTLADSITGDIFTYTSHKKSFDVEVTRTPDSLNLSDGRRLTYGDFPMCLSRFKIKQRYKPRFKTGDVVTYHQGRLAFKAFVIDSGKLYTLQVFGDTYYTYGVPEFVIDR